jgi:hypothetical protein
MGLGELGRRPRGSRPARHEHSGQRCEEHGLGTGGGEGQKNPAGHFDDAGGDLEQPEAQCGELDLGEIPRFGNGVADGEHQPISGGVEDEANLIGAG